MAARELIVATASPPGRGVRGIVRASGDGARESATRLLGFAPRGRWVGRVRMRLADGAVCPAIAMWMERGASFTGEDSLELSCAGNPTLLEEVGRSLIAYAREAGFDARHARPGEFAFRAYLAGRITSEGAEALVARIAASTDAELAAAEALASGSTGVRVGELLGETAELLALVEAGIDFTDQEDVQAIAPGVLGVRASRIAAECGSLRGSQASERSGSVALIVLAGAPNAGKSTLFNTLLGRERTVASEFAGTTRDVVVERVRLGLGIEADLADIAGVESAGDGAIAHAMQEHARRVLALADIVVRCTPHGEEPLALAHAARVIEVRTKVDLAEPGGACAPDTSAIHASAIHSSAIHGTGVDRLRRALAEAVREDHAMRRARLASVLPRHDAALKCASDALGEVAKRAESCATSGRLTDIELVASLLRSALDSLGEIAGPVHPDDVLGLVFSRFCVGK
ncbi:MAG: GTPase [Phycisphaerales bacterium]